MGLCDRVLGQLHRMQVQQEQGTIECGRKLNGKNIKVFHVRPQLSKQHAVVHTRQRRATGGRWLPTVK